MTPPFQRLTVDFGAFAEPLVRQLHGWLPVHTLVGFQRHADAIGNLLIAGLLTAHQARSAEMRLVRKITDEIEAHERDQPRRDK